MLFPYLFKVSFLLMILTLSYRWLIQYETFSKVNRILLFLNVAAAWSLPFLPIAGWGPEKVQKTFHHTIPAVSNVIPSITNREVFAPTLTVQAESYNWDFMNALSMLYFLGILVFTFRFLFQFSGIFYTLRKFRAETLSGNLKIVCNPETTSPYTFFNWIICNPEKHSEKEFEHILSHESEHARQWHSADLLLAELQRIVLWFNPITWLHQRLVAENLEYLADQAVLKHGFEKKQYQFSLLNVALQTKELPLTNSFAQTLLKKRIKMMNKKPSKVWTLGKYGLLILLIYVSSAFVAPYRERIVEMTPSAARQVVAALLPEASLATSEMVKAKDESLTTISNSPSMPSTSHSAPETAKVDSVQLKTKGILIRNDTLYWAISALTTWDDISAIRKEIKDFGSDMSINSFVMEPHNLYLSSISLKINGSSLSAGSGDSKTFAPLRSTSGYIKKESGGTETGLEFTHLSLHTEKDYQTALALVKESEILTSEDKILSSFGNRLRTSTFPKGNFEGSDYIQYNNMLNGSGFSISTMKKLTVEEKLKTATFYVNGKSVGIEIVDSLGLDKLNALKIVDNYEGKYAVLIRTPYK